MIRVVVVVVVVVVAYYQVWFWRRKSRASFYFFVRQMFGNRVLLLARKGRRWSVRACGRWGGEGKGMIILPFFWVFGSFGRRGCVSGRVLLPPGL